MYKQHILKTSDNLLTLYKVSLQYQQLAFTDAEIETLQLLAQVCCQV